MMDGEFSLVDQYGKIGGKTTIQDEFLKRIKALYVESDITDGKHACEWMFDKFISEKMGQVSKKMQNQVNDVLKNLEQNNDVELLKTIRSRITEILEARDES